MQGAVDVWPPLLGFKVSGSRAENLEWTGSYQEDGLYSLEHFSMIAVALLQFSIVLQVGILFQTFKEA